MRKYNRKIKILVIGEGGREHALVWKLKQSPKVDKIFITPGNAGTSKLAINLPLSKIDDILKWLKKNPIDLVIVGPDSYLASGIVDKIQKVNIPVFGPTKTAAKIEWSKSFAKQFMEKENIPTASYKVFTDIKKAKKFLEKQSFPIVIKADGLALGKGVSIVKNLKEGWNVLEKIMENKVFGKAGNRVVIEEYLSGKEISVHAFCDGDNAVLFPAAQDHKKIFDNDQGPNTGGMGTIAPVPWVTKKQMEKIKEKVIFPTLRGLKKRGTPFRGVLFPGIMITKSGPKVIEFNARFGDPETQSYMRLLRTDLVDILLACIKGTLNKQKISWSSKYACCIVAASGGYPGKYKKGKIIKGVNFASKNTSEIFYAATKAVGNQIVTNGGRVLGVTAMADDLREALSMAYSTLDSISFDGMQFRKDIGLKSL